MTTYRDPATEITGVINEAELIARAVRDRQHLRHPQQDSQPKHEVWRDCVTVDDSDPDVSVLRVKPDRKRLLLTSSAARIRLIILATMVGLSGGLALLSGLAGAVSICVAAAFAAAHLMLGTTKTATIKVTTANHFVVERNGRRKNLGPAKELSFGLYRKGVSREWVGACAVFIRSLGEHTFKYLSQRDFVTIEQFCERNNIRCTVKALDHIETYGDRF